MTASTTAQRQSETVSLPTHTEEPAVEEPIEDDELFHLLQTRRRRLVLHYLRDHEGPFRMRDVAEQVAAWEHDTTTVALRSEERQRVYIPLYQTHLPKLDEAGVIEYDKSRGVIETTDRIHQLYSVLSIQDGASGNETKDVEAAAGRTFRDPTTYYGGASVASVGLLTASWAGLIALSGVAVAAVTIALFVLVTLGFDAGG